MSGKRASTTTQPWQWAMTNNKSEWQMIRAATKRARAARAVVMATRVAGKKEGKGSKGHGVKDKGGVQ